MQVILLSQSVDTDIAIRQLNAMNNKQVCQCAGYRDTIVHQRVGIHDGDKLVKEVWLGFKKLWCQIPHD